MISLVILAGLLEPLQRADRRVAEVAWRLQTANAALCERPVPDAGLVVQTLDQFAEAVRDEARTTWGLADAPQAAVVVFGGAAWHAGMRDRDEILAINGVPTPRARGRSANYDATARTEAALAAALVHPPAIVTLRSREVAVTGDAACGSRVQLVPQESTDAVADGHTVQITGPMYALAASDDDLAFVIAHELAHNLFVEARRSARGRRKQRDAEAAADRFAIWMLARAGFEVDTVAAFLLQMGSQRGQGPSDADHPSWAQRSIAAARTAALVKAQKAAGLPLTPILLAHTP